MGATYHCIGGGREGGGGVGTKKTEAICRHKTEMSLRKGFRARRMSVLFIRLCTLFGTKHVFFIVYEPVVSEQVT